MTSFRLLSVVLREARLLRNYLKKIRFMQLLAVVSTSKKEQKCDEGESLSSEGFHFFNGKAVATICEVKYVLLWKQMSGDVSKKALFSTCETEIGSH